MREVEKISLLSEMIAYANQDKIINAVEYNFLKEVALQLNISLLDFNMLVENPMYYVYINSFEERIIQFYRLVLLMYDYDSDLKNENVKLFDFGLQMGLNHESITRTLSLMNDFEDSIVPVDLFINIFKVQFN